MYKLQFVEINENMNEMNDLQNSSWNFDGLFQIIQPHGFVFLIKI